MEEQEKLCTNCKHGDSPLEVGPCRECIVSTEDHGEWENFSI